MRASIDRSGQTGIALLLQDLDAGQTLEQAIERFGVTFVSSEADLMQHVGVSARS